MDAFFQLDGSTNIPWPKTIYSQFYSLLSGCWDEKEGLWGACGHLWLFPLLEAMGEVACCISDTVKEFTSSAID